MKIFNKKAGFTLSEVMLTLTLIGSLSVLTLSTVGASVQQRARLAEFKTAYAKLTTALKNMANDRGKVYSCYAELEQIKDYIEEFSLDPSKTNIRGTGKITECNEFIDNFAIQLGQTRRCKGNQYNECYNPPEPPKGSRLTRTGNARTYILDNGMTMFTLDNGNFFNFGMDLNGRKGPNRWGQDIFAFTVYPKNYLVRQWKHIYSGESGTTLDVSEMIILFPKDFENYDYDAERSGSKNTYQMILETVGVSEN